MWLGLPMAAHPIPSYCQLDNGALSAEIIDEYGDCTDDDERRGCCGEPMDHLAGVRLRDAGFDLASNAASRSLISFSALTTQAKIGVVVMP